MRNLFFILLLILFTSVTSVHSLYQTASQPDEIISERPVHFELLADGSFWGYTESGREFRQIPVPNQYDVRMHKFIIDGTFWYITNRGTIFAPTDLQAVSIYFSMV